MRFIVGTLVLFASYSVYLSTYLYPVWREASFRQYVGEPLGLAVTFDYLGLAALVVILALLIPLAVAKALFRRNRLAFAAVFVAASVALQAAYFSYCGRYYLGQAPRFAVEFRHISFFAEFRNLKMVFSSPLTAAAALAVAWLVTRKTEPSHAEK